MAESYSVEAVLTAVDKSMGSTMKGLQKSISGLEKAKGVFNSVSERGSAMFKTMLGANLASQMVGNMVQSVSGGLKTMVGELNDSKKAWDTFDGNLSQLGWGKKEINSAKEAMQDYATKTIYSASDMAMTFSQMASIGRKDSGELVKAMGGLAASAENPKQAMKSLSQQMVQALAKPKIQWSDFRVMMEQSPAGMSAVAKEMGLSLNELINKIQAGQVKTDDFAEAFKKAGDKMQDMATSYKTIDQAMDGLNETLANKLKPSFDVLSKAGIRALEAIMNQLDKIDFSKMATSLETVLNKIDFDAIAEKVSGFVANAVAKMKEFWQGFQETGVISSFRKTLDEVWEAVKKVISSLAGGDFASFGQKLGRGLTIASEALQAFAKVVQSLSPEQIRGIAQAFIAFKTAKATIGPVTSALNGLSKAVILTKGGIAGLRTVKDVGMALIGISKGSKAASSALTFMAGSSKLAKFALGSLNILTKIGGWIMPAISAIGTFVSGLMEGSAIIGSFSSAWGAIAAVVSGPVGWIIAGVAGIIAGLVLLWNKSEAFRNACIGIWNGIKETASGAWEAIKSAWNSAVEWFSGLWNGIKETASGVWGSFLEKVAPIVEGLKNVWNSLTEFFSTLWSTITQTASNVWNGIVEGIQPIIEGFKEAWNGLTEFFSTLWTGITQTATTAWTGFSEFMAPIVETIKAVWTGFTEFMSTLWTGVVSTAQAIWSTLQPIISAVWQAITVLISTAITIITTVIQAGMAVIKGVWDIAWGTLSTVVSTVWNVIVTVVSTVLNTVAEVIRAGTEAIKGNWQAAWDHIKNATSTVWEGIKSVVNTVINAIKTIIDTVMNAIKNVIDTIWNGIKSSVTNIMNGIKESVTSIWEGLKSSITSTIEAIKTTVVDTANSLKEGFVNAIENMKSSVSGIIDNIKSIFGSLANIDLASAGSAIMNGFLGGLKSAWGAVQNFVGGIASWIKAHKGPISYDRRLLIPAGEAIMGGFNSALMTGFGIVQGNVSGMAGGIRSMFDDAGSRVSTMSSALQDNFTNNVSGTLSATYELNQAKEPAVISLSLGSNDFRAFVSDISNIQNKEERIRLKASSL